MKLPFASDESRSSFRAARARAPGPSGRIVRTLERQFPDRERLRAGRISGKNIEFPSLPASQPALRKKLRDADDGMPSPALDLDQPGEASEGADKIQLNGAEVKRVAPESLVEAQEKCIDLFERKRSGFMDPAAEVRASHVFDVSLALGESAQRPGIVPKYTLPMLDIYDDEKNNNEADSQGWPENSIPSAFRGQSDCDANSISSADSTNRQAMISTMFLAVVRINIGSESAILGMQHPDTAFLRGVNIRHSGVFD